MENSKRVQRWKRPSDLESLLNEINTLLAPGERRLCVPGSAPEQPVVLVVGPSRSGTTLMMQWLATSGVFAYPSNLLSRFYGAPAVGARIQQLLCDPRFAYKDELADLAGELEFRSELGKTRGALSPSEFWHFWRRFTPDAEFQRLTAEQRERFDCIGLREEAAAIEAAFGQPFAMKAVILQDDLDLLLETLPSAFFLCIEREPFYNAQSLLEARVNFFGTRETWWSNKPPGWERLLERDPLTQVGGQVALCHRSLRDGLAALPKGRSLTVPYEALCRDPQGTWRRLAECLEPLGLELPAAHPGPDRFEVQERQRLTDEERAQVDAGYAEYLGAEVTP